MEKYSGSFFPKKKFTRLAGTSLTLIILLAACSDHTGIPSITDSASTSQPASAQLKHDENIEDKNATLAPVAACATPSAQTLDNSETQDNNKTEIDSGCPVVDDFLTNQ
jgi:hypothetical protein